MKTIFLLLALACALSAATWTMMIIPDPQAVTATNVPGWDTMIQYILDRRVPDKIVAVLGVGDLVENPASATEWTNAKQGSGSLGWNALMSSGLVNASPAGNHDTNMEWIATPHDRPGSWFQPHFGPARYAGKSWYGSSNYEVNNGQNFYLRFNAEGFNFLVLGMELYPRPGVLTWAQSIIDANPGRHVIVLTHGYLAGSTSRFTDTQLFGPVDYGMEADWSSNGQEIWDGLLKTRKNVLLIVGGHANPGAPAYRSDAGDEGNVVHQVFAGHGSGTLTRLVSIQFSSEDKTMTFRQFNASDPGTTLATFTLDYEPLGIGSAEMVGTSQSNGAQSMR